MNRGRKPTCTCNNCKICVARATSQRYRLRKKGVNVPRKKREFHGYTRKSDRNGELERRMIQYFIGKGWETEEWQRTKSNVKPVDVMIVNVPEATKCPKDRESETSKDHDMISSHWNFSTNSPQSLRKAEDLARAYLMDTVILGRKGGKRFSEIA